MKIKQEVIIEEVYNLILNTNIKNNERELFINFKNNYQQNYCKAFTVLLQNISNIAISNIGSHNKLSKPVNDFYNKYFFNGLFEKNIASGLIYYSSK